MTARSSKVVKCVGPAQARGMIVGQAPGKTECAVGLPFVGPAGLFLRMTLRTLGIDDQDVFLTNASRQCGSVEPVDKARARLGDEIRKCDPKAILVLGRRALYVLTGIDERVGSVAGEWHATIGAVTPRKHKCVMSTYHPAGVWLKGGLAVWDRRADILKWRSAIWGTRPTPNRTTEEAILAALLGISRSHARTLLRTSVSDP